MKKIAIIGSIHEDGINYLKTNNFECFEIEDLSKNNLIHQLKDVDGIIIRTAKLESEIINQCTKLKIVARHGVGYDNIDINFLNEKKIALGVTSTSNAVSVAEQVISFFLYLAKRIDKSDHLVKKGNFDQKHLLPNFFEMYQKKILILGFGRIGQAVAKRCLGFESEVLVYDPFVQKEIIENNSCKKIDFKEGIKIADFITIHMPLNKDTMDLIRKDENIIMKENCILVNTARGGIVNETDLSWALKNNKIRGAGLDVFKEEPPLKSSPLFQLDNIVLSPHNAALTLECRKRMAVESAENIVNFLVNKSELNYNNIVNKENLSL